MKRIFIVFLLMIFESTYSQSESIDSFIAKWKLAGNFNSSGKKIETKFNSKYDYIYYKHLKSNGNYSTESINSKKKGKNKTKVLKSTGKWSYDSIKQVLVFEKLLEKNDIKNVPKNYQQVVDGITYLKPVAYRIELINDRKLILYDEFHNTYIHYEK